MITYELLNKTKRPLWLPQLFDLYYHNMKAIAPSGLAYEEERREWLAAVSPALDKAPRQILLCLVDGKLEGYIQYYTREALLMIEEAQLSGSCRNSTAFLGMIRALVRLLPGEIRYVEAYAHRRNARSIALMRRLGMEGLPEPESSPFVHFRGCIAEIRPRFIRNQHGG